MTGQRSRLVWEQARVQRPSMRGLVGTMSWYNRITQLLL